MRKQLLNLTTILSVGVFCLQSCKKDNPKDEGFFISFTYNNKNYRLDKDSAFYFNAFPYPVNGRHGLGLIAQGNQNPIRFYLTQTDTTLGSAGLYFSNPQANRYIYEATLAVPTSNAVTNLNHITLGVPGSLSFKFIINRFTDQYLEGSFEGSLRNMTTNAPEQITNGRIRIPYVR